VETDFATANGQKGGKEKDAGKNNFTGTGVNRNQPETSSSGRPSYAGRKLEYEEHQEGG